MSTHTPRPWMKTTENKGAIPEHFRPLVVTNGSGDRVVARLPDGWDEENRANADLITAAPELLDVLHKLIDRAELAPDNAFGVWRIESSIDGVIVEARAAIAKAEGREA